MKKIIIIFILFVLIIFFSKVYVVTLNNNYKTNLEKELHEKYDIKDKIKYLNKTNNCYIIKTTKNLIVLDYSFVEILKEDVDKIKDINKDYEFVYRLNKLMYEVKNVSNNKIIYEYYDIYTGELVDTLEIGG